MPHNTSTIPNRLTGRTGQEDRNRVDFVGVRLLIAEAGFPGLERFSNLLEEFGIRYVAVASGNELLQKAKEAYFDLILMDHEIPGIDGPEAAGRIRNEENPNRATPIILTHAASPEIVRAAHDAGVNELLYRPYTADQLLSLLKKYLLEEETAKEELHASAGFEFNPRLDSAYLLKLFGNNFEYAYDLFQLFTGCIEKELKEIRLSMQRQDWKKMQALAHKIKPNFSMVGLTWITGSMQEVYDKLRAKDYAPIEEMMLGIMNELDAYLPLVREEQKRLEAFLKPIQDIPHSA